MRQQTKVLVKPIVVVFLLLLLHSLVKTTSRQELAQYEGAINPRRPSAIYPTTHPSELLQHGIEIAIFDGL